VKYWETCILVNGLMVQMLSADSNNSKIHCVSKNVPPLTCYNLDVHDPITIIFGGRSFTKKVGNQTMLCYPTSSIWWFCTTLRNRKPRNCVFSLKHCCIANEHKTHSNYHLVAVELPFIPKVIDCMHQTIKTYLEREHSILLSVTCTLYVNQVCHSVSRCVKDESCSSSSLE